MMRYDFMIYEQRVGLKGFLEDYESIICTKILNDVGECEIITPITARNLELLQEDYILVNPNPAKVILADKALSERNHEAYEAFIITAVTIDDKEHKITARGVSYEQMLNYRVDGTVRSMWQPFDPSEAISALFYEAFVMVEQLSLQSYIQDGYAHYQSTRDVYRTLDYTITKGDYQSSFASFLEVYQKLFALMPELSFGCFYNVGSKGNEFGIFEVLALRTNSNVIFSETFENLINTSITRDKTEYSNRALVAGEGEGAERVTVWTPIPDGLRQLEVRETFVDARDLQSEDYGSTDNYKKALIARGIEKLIEPVVTYEFEIPEDSQFKYKEDFYLGDTVTIEIDKYNVALQAQVAQAVESYSAEGYKVEISFGNLQETLSKRLKKRFGR